MRGATCRYRKSGRSARYFNPRSPCGERRGNENRDAVHRDFNPRSPCGERHDITETVNASADFNPRSPCGERLTENSDTQKNRSISIHAPHAGSDPPAKQRLKRPNNFNPRSPCGERPIFRISRPWAGLFQSTLPMRGATFTSRGTSISPLISIHAPHAGSDG